MSTSVLTSPTEEQGRGLDGLDLPGVIRAQGNVVVAGLGLSWFLRKVHAKESVSEIVVVEKDRDLLDWYGHALCLALPKVTDVICGDAYDHLGKHGRRTKYLYDIWPSLGQAHQDREFQAKKRRFAHVWAWGDWAQKSP